VNRDFDSCPIHMLAALALLLYGLASAMADDKTDEARAAVQDKSRNGKSGRKIKVCEPNGCGHFADSVPSFKLKDPLETEHDSSSLFNQTGMLIMITVPNLTQYEKQKRWEKYMTAHGWPTTSTPRRVVLEDLSQQETFKNKVRAMMKDKYKADGEYTVLIDEDGGVRKQFGVQDNETVILLADSQGRIIHNERDEIEPDRDAANRLMAQVHLLAGTFANAQKHIQAPLAHTAPMIMATGLPARRN
jgi:hypothetical protein